MRKYVDPLSQYLQVVATLYNEQGMLHEVGKLHPGVRKVVDAGLAFCDRVEKDALGSEEPFQIVGRIMADIIVCTGLTRPESASLRRQVHVDQALGKLNKDTMLKPTASLAVRLTV